MLFHIWGQMPDELRNMLLDVNQNGDLKSIARSEHDPMDMQMQVEQEIHAPRDNV